MIGYHINANLALLEQQLLTEYDNAASCEQTHCTQCETADTNADCKIPRTKISSAISFARAGLVLEAFREIDAVSRVSFCEASLLHLVAGDLGRAAGCHFDACNAYKRVKWLHPVYYPEALSRKGRTYTAELMRWRDLGLRPVTVAMYGGDGGEKYLLELVADPLLHSAAMISPADARSQLAGLSHVERLYLEMVINTLPGEEFEEEDQWPIYGYSAVSSMGPYITTRQQAAEKALSFVNHWFYDLQRQNPQWRDEEADDNTWALLARMLRIPREYATNNFKSNEDIANDMIYGRRLRYSTNKWGRGWLDWMGSIEPIPSGQ